MVTDLSAANYLAHLTALQSAAELQKIQRYFKSGEGQYGAGDTFLGVRMGQVFELSKEFIEMPLAEIEKLLESDLHEVRAGGLSIMSKKAAHKKTTASQKQALYDLYLRRTDRINNWDLVDVAAPNVVGGYLVDKPRTILYDLARSENLWERRTAIVSTLYFVKRGESDDAFQIAEILINDPEDLIHKAVGWALRAAGDLDRPRLLHLLDQHAATMPRTLLRYAIEHFDPEQRAHYMALKKTKSTPQ